jgi:hypothetical protein
VKKINYYGCGNLIIVSRNFLMFAMTADPLDGKSPLDVVFYRCYSSEHCHLSSFL